MIPLTLQCEQNFRDIKTCEIVHSVYFIVLNVT